MLKARTTTNYNYDPLVLPLIEMKRLWREFGTLEGRHQKQKCSLGKGFSRLPTGL